MGVEVHLSVVGLCMYVPGRSELGDDRVLHVLMPKHRHERGDTHVPHRALLMYRAAHNPVDGPEPKPHGCVELPIDGCAVTIAGRFGASEPPPAPGVSETYVTVLDERANFHGVALECLDPLPNGRVHARLELRNAGHPFATEHDNYYWLGKEVDSKMCLTPAGARCDHPDAHDPRFMAEIVEWDLGSYPAQVTLADIFSPAQAGPGPTLPRKPLQPVSGRVDLTIAYVVDEAKELLCTRDWKPAPTASRHFVMYYELGVDGAGQPYEPAKSGKVSIKAPSDACSATTAAFRVGVQP